MKKKLLGCLLVMMCCVGMFTWHDVKANAKSDVAKKSLKLNGTELKKLTIHVKDCNIKVMKTDKADPYCEYDNSICNVTMSKKDQNATINMEIKPEKCFQMYEDNGSMNEVKIYKVYLPAKLKVSHVEVMLDKAGASMEHIPDADVKITGDKSAMGLREPEDFKHKIAIDLKSSSGTIGVQNDHLNQITFTEKASSTNYPDECVKTIHKKNNRIKINVRSSSFTIKKKSEMSKNGYNVISL